LLGWGRRFAVQETIQDRPATTCARNAQGDAHGLAVLFRKRIGQVLRRRERESARRIASALRRSAVNSRSFTSCLSELQPKTPSIAFFNLACFIDDSQNASFRNRMLLLGSRKSTD
jgi:hypothetical protein